MTKAKSIQLSKRIIADLATIGKLYDNAEKLYTEIVGSSVHDRFFTDQLRAVKDKFVDCYDLLADYLENA